MFTRAVMEALSISKTQCQTNTTRNHPKQLKSHQISQKEETPHQRRGICHRPKNEAVSFSARVILHPF